MKTHKTHKHPNFIDEMDADFTGKAEYLFEELVSKEGFSDEQAFSMAMAEVGEADGDLDLEVSEDELVEREEEPIHVDIAQPGSPPLRHRF